MIKQDLRWKTAGLIRWATGGLPPAKALAPSSITMQARARGSHPVPETHRPRYMGSSKLNSWDTPECLNLLPGSRP